MSACVYIRLQNRKPHSFLFWCIFIYSELFYITKNGYYHSTYKLRHFCKDNFKIHLKLLGYSHIVFKVFAHHIWRIIIVRDFLKAATTKDYENILHALNQGQMFFSNKWTAYLGDYTIKCMFRGLYDHWLALPSGRQCISLPYSWWLTLP